MSGSAPFNRKLGKKPAVADHRVRALSSRLTVPKLPTPPATANWYAKQPAAGIPMLYNDEIGDCVAATACHYVGNASCYTAQHAPLVPTPEEALAIYEHSGYRPTKSPPDSNDTDQGWTVLGPGGLIEFWSKGLAIGGKNNHVSAVASVNFKNPVEVRQAIYLFGFVLTGAMLSEEDVESPFMWDQHRGQIVGGHEFLTCGYEQVAGEYYYDVITWNGMWRYSESWLLRAVDEQLVIYDEVFFNVRGLSGAGLDRKTLAEDMAAFTGTA